MVAVGNGYSARAYKGGAVMLKNEDTGLRITFDRSKGMMFVDYPTQYLSEVFPPVIDGLTDLGIKAQIQTAEEMESHHMRFALPSVANSNDQFRAVVGKFVKVGVLDLNAETALHNVLLQEEGKPPSSPSRQVG
jgi:hypothetical protein